MKYTPEQTQELIKAYSACETQTERAELLDDFSVRFGKTVHSLRAKLVAEGVYVSSKRTSTFTGTAPKTKIEMVDEMEVEFGFPIGSLEGLENAPKMVLIRLYNKMLPLKKLT
jgi:hypothetical protein